MLIDPARFSGNLEDAFNVMCKSFCGLTRSHPQTTMKGMSNEPILVTGATGKTGRRVAQQLEEAGVPVVRASRRSPTPFDWNDPRTWEPALQRVQAAYIAPAEGTLAVPAFVSLAHLMGLQQVVLLSARGVTTPGYYDEQDYLAPQFLVAERAVRESGLRYTILRPGWFSQNFSEGAFRSAVDSGELVLPAGDGSSAFIDAHDIAAVACAALTDPERYHGAELELTGPSAVSIATAVELISAASGREVRYRNISADEYHAELLRSGESEHDAKVATIALSPIRSGREGETTSTVKDVLGRDAIDFSSFVKQAFAT